MTSPTIATIIFILTLAVILTEKIHRSIVAMMGAVLMVIAGIVLGFYSEEQAIISIEFDALGLLLGMMILVSILQPTGFFQSAAIRAGQLSKGDPWRLLILLGTGTALVSMVINNVSTIVMVAPLTILIAELLGFSPIPFLMAETLLSVTSAIGTSIGDPASLLVSIASGYSFIDFLTHAMPIVIAATLITLLMIRVLFSEELAAVPEDPHVVEMLDADEALTDVNTARRVMIILGFAILFFVFQERLNLSTGFIALSAAAVALTWIRPEFREVLERIDWPVFFFFTGLFILVGGLEHAGVFEPVTKLLAGIGQENPVLLGIVIIWVVAGLSALIDNIPVTIAMISLLHSLQASGVDVSALWWAVVFGAGFGGNATYIGSTANIVVVSLSEQTRFPITAKVWMKKGMPIAIATCLVGSLLFVFAYPWLGQ
ncbi:MAG: SLC13 family permease [Anaerolineales bacterium]|jgi:Na+/H+ antiporter NhaD/arsenite permease-like protein